jgi:hypothetical protein
MRRANVYLPTTGSIATGKKGISQRSDVRSESSLRRSKRQHFSGAGDFSGAGGTDLGTWFQTENARRHTAISVSNQWY